MIDPPTLLTLLETVKFAVGSYTWARKQLEKKSPHAIVLVNALINRNRNQGDALVTVYRIVKRAPTVTIEGPVAIPAEVGARASVLRPSLELNEMHALAPTWNGTEVDTIRAKTCDFADVKALRELPADKLVSRPPVLSAGAVVVCPTERYLLLHQRSATSDTKPNLLHILGGAYKPPIQHRDIDNPGDRFSLEFTMLREVFEESGLIVRRYDEPVCVAQELDTGFIQYVYLGVRITSAQSAQLSQNSEGDLERVPFDELKKQLADKERWVPTGRAQILMWLGLGAPGAGWRPRFDGKTATELFDLITQ